MTPIKQPYFRDLPRDVYLTVFSLLSSGDLDSMELVSRYYFHFFDTHAVPKRTVQMEIRDDGELVIRANHSGQSAGGSREGPLVFPTLSLSELRKQLGHAGRWLTMERLLADKHLAPITFLRIRGYQYSERYKHLLLRRATQTPGVLLFAWEVGIGVGVNDVVYNLSRRAVYFIRVPGMLLSEVCKLVNDVLSVTRRARELQYYEGMRLKETFFIWTGPADQWTAAEPGWRKQLDKTFHSPTPVTTHARHLFEEDPTQLGLLLSRCRSSASAAEKEWLIRAIGGEWQLWTIKTGTKRGRNEMGGGAGSKRLQLAVSDKAVNYMDKYLCVVFYVCVRS